MNKTEFRALGVEEMRALLQEVFEDPDGEFSQMNKDALTQFGIDNWDDIDWEEEDESADESESEEESDEDGSDEPESELSEDDDPEAEADSEGDVPEEDHPVRNLDLGYRRPDPAPLKSASRDLA